MIYTDSATVATPRWEHFPHGADIGIRGIGCSKAAAFEQAALALTAVISEPRTVAAVSFIEINCAAPDDELLLVEWLNALVYETATRRMLFAKFAVTIDGHKLTAKAWGEAIDRSRHDIAVEVKGATCTELKVTQAAEGAWLAQCIVDV